MEERTRVLTCARNKVGVVIEELEEALEASARVLGTLAIKAVWQEEDEGRLLVPFALPRDDEVVNDVLSHVGKVPELGLPHDQRQVALERIAVLEAQHGSLGQRRVAHLEMCLWSQVHVVQWGVRLRRCLVVQYGMSVIKGAALTVLPAKAHVHSRVVNVLGESMGLEGVHGVGKRAVAVVRSPNAPKGVARLHGKHQTAKSQLLRHRHVHLAFFHPSSALLHELNYHRVGSEGVGDAGDGPADGLERLHRDAREVVGSGVAQRGYGIALPVGR